VNDAADFVELQTAMSRVGISVTEQWMVFRLLAALLHLGESRLDVIRRTTLCSTR